MEFEPIAVVGRGCVLPDALDPDTFWENIAAGRTSLSAVPEDRWRLPRRWAMGSVDDHLDRTWTDVGGYVRGFESVFDPSGFRIAPERILSLDPLFHWVMYGVRQALTEAGREGPLPRAGLVLGNLSYPTPTGAALAEHVWLSAQRPPLRDALLTGERRRRPDALNRFSSGLPARLAARALGLGAGAWSLDAACASSLYAVKLACDRLHDGTADLMVAGAVSRADPLFLHVGFCGLSATSRTGRSRPFHRDADGLVHGEGAGFVALMRLSEARAAQVPVLGVIRGVGLSNDGRGAGLISPSEEGQIRAMRLAYDAAGVAPGTVSLVECHATGTPLGDAVEARGMARVFGTGDDVPIGSVKSNVGHLLASAGVAGLLKVLGALRAGVRPATLGAERPLEALAGTPLRLLTAPEPWSGPRRAAVSAFGFGGTNAHLVVDLPNGDPVSAVRRPSRPAVAVTAPIAPTGVREAPGGRTPVAIVALGARVGDGTCTEDFRRAVLGGERRGPAAGVTVELTDLCFPPVGLERTVRHQLLVLEAAREAVRSVSLPRERTMVVVGMGVDPEVARAGARWRVPHWLERAGLATTPESVDLARDTFLPPVTAEGVVGTLPNLVANRISTQLDLAGPGFAVSAEEASGLVALELAARAVRSGEVDAALVGATDLSCEAVHRSALRELGRENEPGDAAVVLVLKSLDTARRDGDTVIALLDEDCADAPDMVIGDGADAVFDPASSFGRAHAAYGLVSVAVAALSLQHRAVPRPGLPADTAAGAHTAMVAVTPLEGPSASVRLRAADARPWLRGRAPRLHVFCGADRREVLAALESGAESSAGPARLALVADDDALPGRMEAARRWLAEGGARPADVLYRDRPVTGRTAFVYTNGSAAYAGMGHELMLALPSLGEAVRARHGAIGARLRSGAERGVLDQIWGAAELAVHHTVFTREVLGLRPDAALGYSSGESAALVALGAWPDAAGLYDATRDSGLFTTELTGELRAVRRHWERLGVEGRHWSSFLVSAPLEAVRAELAAEAAVHLMAVNAPGVCVIGGEARACAAVVARIGADRTIELDYDMAAHAPELAEIRDVWRAVHHRPTVDVPGVRFYSGATGESYRPTAERAAEALTAQGLNTIDFGATVERAWADGVRVFVEHGPRKLCTGWIRRVLGDRDHVAVALDAPGDTRLRQTCLAVAELVVAGVPVHADGLFNRLAEAATEVPRPGPTVTVPVLAPPCLPPLEPAPVTLPRAPELAPVPDREAARSDAPVAAAGPFPGVAGPRPLPDVRQAHSDGRDPAVGVRAAVLRQSRRVAALHQEITAGHIEAHQRFLRMSALAVTALRSTGPVPVRSAPRPAFPPAPPPEAAEAAGAAGAGAVPPPEAAPAPLLRPGPKFDRAQLEHLASREISTLFGPRFAEQDAYAVQTRMPGPPMLFADRVTGIDAVPAALVAPGPVPTDGMIWTETDVRPDSWYLDSTGRMPAGMLIEAGQADLLLLSWLGVDLLNQGERAYRLLGCEVTYHGGPPGAGDILRYEIHIDGHAEHDGIRLAFFHYDCYVDGELRLSIREGQAGFFTPEELAGGGGVRWDPAERAPGDDLPLDPPAVRCERTRFDADRVRALTQGRPADCFGPGWEATAAHVRPPRLDDGRLRLIDEVTVFDPAGGPWGRGYLRAETPLSPDDWFFEGHFKNDPCMPGTLMLQGGLQAMAFYLAAMGFTVNRDGWRFEPVDGHPCRTMCRGQATPVNQRVVYEVFVRGVSAGPAPTLYADVLGSVDGARAFLGRDVALRLVPDWPLSHWRGSGPPVVQGSGTPVPLPLLGGLAGHEETKPVATAADGFPFDYASLLACAWGRPSEAFGTAYEPFDGTRKVARLPGPPYHFMSRIVSVDGPQGGMREGSGVVAEYDVPARAWYFEQSGGRTMPFAVLMEIALQPCGWLASYVGSALTTGADLLFRNLDGAGTVTGEVTPATGTVRTHVELTRVSRSGDMIIESFRVRCTADDVPLFDLSTVFGYFPPSAFDQQQGLTVSARDRARLDEPCDRVVDLTARPARYCAGEPRLPGPMLLMLDRITGCWPDGGSMGLGRLRSEKDVVADEWFFRAHFFQDPVQPGSLGVEAMCQLLQYHLLERGAADGVPHPRFEPVLPGRETTWTYRGQITPANRLIRVDMDIVESGTDERGPYALADASLWGDDTCIYRVRGLGMRVVSDASA
ncbi:beta-ketoacyl synthase N-terminal-like domain-containing protein [Streptomyces niveus]|uniref:beta-ketoacyl synthase N-terminal-like domain-containing protein n=1 Tax=Streptomyces niveus TaxID=193462 RepID=UPI0036D21821